MHITCFLELNLFCLWNLLPLHAYAFAAGAAAGYTMRSIYDRSSCCLCLQN